MTGKRRAALNRPSEAGWTVALSYVGISILLIGLFTLIGLVVDEHPAWIALPFGLALVSAGLAWLGRDSELTEISDCFAIVTILLAALGLRLLLDEVGGGLQDDISGLLLSLCVLLTGSWMAWLVRSPRAAALAALALTMLPLTIVSEIESLDPDVFDGGLGGLSNWELWSVFAATVALGGGALYLLERLQRLGAGLLQWGRLGASMGATLAVLALASVQGEALIDWLMLLLGWILTVWAVRTGRVELLLASGFLLVGALVGGLSNLGNEARLGLTIVGLFTTLQMTALEIAGPRVLGRLGDHWLTPFWEATLLIGGIAAAVVLAERSLGLAIIAIVWAVALLVAGGMRQRWLEVLFGVASVYAVGLTLLVAQFETSLGAVIGMLFLGLIMVAGAIIWRRRMQRLTLAEGGS